MNEDKKEVIVKLGTAIERLFLDPLVLKLAWNASLPSLFNLSLLDYWQAFCLLLIVHIIRAKVVINKND